MNDFANNKKRLLTKLEITEDCSLYTSYLKGKWLSLKKGHFHSLEEK